VPGAVVGGGYAKCAVSSDGPRTADRAGRAATESADYYDQLFTHVECGENLKDLSGKVVGGQTSVTSTNNRARAKAPAVLPANVARGEQGDAGRGNTRLGREGGLARAEVGVDRQRGELVGRLVGGRLGHYRPRPLTVTPSNSAASRLAAASRSSRAARTRGA